jgi:hypothetical protein
MLSMGGSTTRVHDEMIFRKPADRITALIPLTFSTRRRIPQFTTKYLISYALFLHCDT